MSLHQVWPDMMSHQQILSFLNDFLRSLQEARHFNQSPVFSQLFAPIFILTYFISNYKIPKDTLGQLAINAVKPMRFPTSDFKLLEDDSQNFAKEISLDEMYLNEFKPTSDSSSKQQQQMKSSLINTESRKVDSELINDNVQREFAEEKAKTHQLFASTSSLSPNTMNHSLTTVNFNWPIIQNRLDYLNE